jgi:hypothetical protein
MKLHSCREGDFPSISNNVCGVKAFFERRAARTPRSCFDSALVEELIIDNEGSHVICRAELGPTQPSLRSHIRPSGKSPTGNQQTLARFKGQNRTYTEKAAFSNCFNLFASNSCPAGSSSLRWRVGFLHVPQRACPSSSVGLRERWERDGSRASAESPARVAAASSASSPAAGPWTMPTATARLSATIGDGLICSKAIPLHGRTGMQPIADVETWIRTPPTPTAVCRKVFLREGGKRTTDRANI